MREPCPAHSVSCRQIQKISLAPGRGTRRNRFESKGRSVWTGAKADYRGHTQGGTAMPTQTLDTAEPETLRFGYGDTALGTIVVAESMRGIVALFIGDDRANLLRDLKDAFPEAGFVLDQTGLAPTIAKVI